MLKVLSPDKLELKKCLMYPLHKYSLNVIYFTIRHKIFFQSTDTRYWAATLLVKEQVQLLNTLLTENWIWILKM